MCQLDKGMIGNIGCLFYLLLLSVQDIRSHTVSVRFLTVGGILAMVWQIICREQTLLMCAAGVVTGLAFIGISRLTKEAFGYGDSVLILILGIYAGVQKQLIMLVLAFGISAIFSMIMLTTGRWNRKKAFPFIPFLTVGYILMSFIG